MKGKLLLLSFFALTFTSSLSAQINFLKQELEKIISDKNAIVRVAIQGQDPEDSLSINESIRFPMQSVFKFYIALAVLNEVDNGRLNLNQEIFIKKEDLLPNTWSPIRKKYPTGEIYLKLSEILKYTVSESDNNGCDILLNLIGGPKVVTNYIHRIGIEAISIQATEAEMHKDWETQFTNWTTPIAANKLLLTFYDKKILSKENFVFLQKIMLETSTGKNLIKGQLPKETLVAHRSGLSETNKKGVTAAINDIGIITLPNEKYFALSIFVTNSTENNETNEQIISDI